jgi:UDP-N-acetylglucosamine--dolichyl-phosphate N-acetylglucosaminephosphotransferase
MDGIIFLGILFVPVVLISFILTLGILPKWIKKAREIGLVWEDVHKKGSPKNVAGSGGVAVLVGFLIAIFLYIAIKTFIFETETNLIKIFGLITTVVLAGAVGLIDDLFGWKKGGMSKRNRIILMICIAIPLMVLNVGESTVLGIDFGIFYPLILVPFAIVGATTVFNFLAGYNGLEATQGILVLFALTIVNFLEGNLWLSLIGASMITSLIAFWFFNKNPAAVFPGDVMTYVVGALIACIAILGNIEKIALFFFIPYAFEFFLKARGKFKKQSFSKLDKEGNLEPLYPKIYSLNHIAVRILRKIKGKARESEVVFLINCFQILIIVLGFIFVY